MSNPLFLVPFLVGLIFVIMSIVARKIPPSGINTLYGYRTRRSMKSQQQWDFAQEHSNTLMHRYGCLLILLGIVGYFTTFSNMIGLILALFSIILASAAIIIRTENALKENFGEE